jgi:hypothetical protein
MAKERGHSEGEEVAENDAFVSYVYESIRRKKDEPLMLFSS